MASDGTFHDPHVSLTRIYTKAGDGGETRLVGGHKVAKDDPRIEAYGTVDELDAFTGLARLSAVDAGITDLASTLLRVQHELFNLGSLLATRPEDLHPRQPRITGGEVEQLEREIDACNRELAPLRSFVLPGSTRLNAELHACRTICRRAERALVAMGRSEPVPPEALRYLNRLSDAYFVWSRWACRKQSAEETLWQPNQAASIPGPAAGT
jgi:cob(I)alamin adenosyltransferase